MATKTTTPKTETKNAASKPRKQRTPDQIVADLESEIARVKARAAAREAKAAPEGKPFMLAVKAADKAIEAAREAGNREMFQALETARAALGEQLIRMGVRAPQARKRRGRGEAA
jgi:hypothetical protein